MGQQDIVDLLKENKEIWFSTKDLRRVLKVSGGGMSRCLKRLRASDFVIWEKRKNAHNRLGEFYYKHKG